MQKASRFVMEDGKLKYLGEVKRPASFSPDPTVDHVMSNLPDTDQQQRTRCQVSAIGRTHLNRRNHRIDDERADICNRCR